MSQRQKWDDKANADLLILIVEELKPTQAQLVAIAANAQTMGYTYTPKAISYCSFLSFPFFLFHFVITFDPPRL